MSGANISPAVVLMSSLVSVPRTRLLTWRQVGGLSASKMSALLSRSVESAYCASFSKCRKPPVAAKIRTERVVLYDM